MTVIVKVGRRIHRNEDRKWFARQISNMKNTVSIQQYMWKTIEYGFKLSTIKMDKDIKKGERKGEDVFTYSKRKYKEEESLNYNIEWLEIIIKGNEAFEQEEYEQAMKFFSKLEQVPVFQQKKGNLTLDPELSGEYKGKLKGARMKKILKSGFDKAKDITISKSLNDIGILTIIEKLDEDDIQEQNQQTEEKGL